MKLCAKCKKNQIKYYLKIYHCKDCNTAELFKILRSIQEDYKMPHVAFNGNSSKYEKQKRK